MPRRLALFARRAAQSQGPRKTATEINQVFG
jgi:hypothetical protein